MPQPLVWNQRSLIKLNDTSSNFEHKFIELYLEAVSPTLAVNRFQILGPKINGKCICESRNWKWTFLPMSLPGKTPPRRLSSHPTRYFTCTCVVHQTCYVANDHLISYPQQCHIGINVNHWYIIMIAIHLKSLFVFSRAELWIIFISYSLNCHMLWNTNELTI